MLPAFGIVAAILVPAWGYRASGPAVRRRARRELEEQQDYDTAVAYLAALRRRDPQPADVRRAQRALALGRAHIRADQPVARLGHGYRRAVTR